LQTALASGDCTELIAFIRRHVTALTDPYEGKPLADDWEKLIETPDAHQYGDFALTKNYVPKDDRGLGGSWEKLQEMLANEANLSSSPILGSLVGTVQAPFDPGKLGSYFQSPGQVVANLARLQSLALHNQSEAINEAIQLLEHAVQSRKGLYVTF
jgi:hypothetical protein